MSTDDAGRNAGDADGAAGPDAADSPDADGDEAAPGLYVESTIIMTTVRLVSPFILTFALFIMFHGADTPGGGFQGGVIAGSVVMMLAFAYGIDSTRQWLDGRVIAALASGGVYVFVGIGLGAIALGGQFLQYAEYEALFGHAIKYAIELVELSIGAIVAAVAIGLFFLLAAGFDHAIEEDPS
ncbi:MULTISPECIES: Na(+)/H(+) antiporter subunit B [Halorubrum]|uniref:Multicomponent Na+:H+ antiporter subunit B n=1 Tax=Halorubrum sodomense TaxID=35743 RepID=A0A1I6GPT8_HALSD|nr:MULTISPECIES: Na(+)/H(+) antiporter subunit B [Halorubrum]TKX55210.1 cation:proton antiporter [Halorubrum sp. SP3]TKX70270.1 cation:proton antiporter [Halorubrum sp. SP9]SFR44214.1 multicomponent Na+:H+ antiporter subunit B [Halorubrum sodomense]